MTLFVFIKSICIGCLFYTKKGDSICNPKKTFDPTYIIWLDKGVTFMTKKDACFDYSVTAMSNTSFWKYYFDNKNAIKGEKLKNPQYTEIIQGKETTHSLEIDHSVHYNIEIKIGKDSITKDINEFYFTKEVGIHQGTNINYEYNMSSFTKKLQQLIIESISQQMKKKKVTRIPR